MKEDAVHTSTVDEWGAKSSANLHPLWTRLGKLLHVAQCCFSARLFLNRMLTILRECPDIGNITLSSEFCKDLQWFRQYVACTNGLSMMEEDSRQSIHIYMNACITVCSVLCQKDAYHAVFPEQEGSYHGWVVLHSDSYTAVEIFQSGKGRNSHIHVCAREIWLACAIHDVTHTCTHMPDEKLVSTSDTLSRFHKGGAGSIMTAYMSL